MRPTSYDLVNVLRQFQDEVNRLVDEGTVGRSAESDGSSAVTSHWTPAVDIREEPGEFVLTADLPGVEASDIEVTMQEGMLVIRGERKLERSDEGGGFKRVERVHGSFYRRFTLPDVADPEGVSARSENGVLTVKIPKRAATQPRKISVDG